MWNLGLGKTAMHGDDLVWERETAAGPGSKSIGDLEQFSDHLLPLIASDAPPLGYWSHLVKDKGSK
jgi:hypothetical protein